MGDCACAEVALSSNRPKANSRILIQLPRGLALFVSLEIIYALVPTYRDDFISNEAVRAWTGFRRSRRRRAPPGPLDR